MKRKPEAGRLLIAWVVVCRNCEIHKIFTVGVHNPRRLLRDSEWQEMLGYWWCPICSGNRKNHEQ